MNTFAGIEAIADFIREIGLPTKFSEMGISAETDFEAIARTSIRTGGCVRKLTDEEILEILRECI